MNRIEDVRVIELSRHAERGGEIVVAEVAAQVPFGIKRMFALTAPAGAQRGRHAHRHCAQFMVCVHGAMDVVCTDGRADRTFTLDRRNLALLVPPTIWNTVNVHGEGSVLVVLCDRPYEEHDYIRDYQEFMIFRTGAHS